MIAQLLMASVAAYRLHDRSYVGVRFVDDYQYDTPINPEEISNRVVSDPTFETSFGRHADIIRPGWSGTRGIHSRIDNDEANEFG